MRRRWKIAATVALAAWAIFTGSASAGSTPRAAATTAPTTSAAPQASPELTANLAKQLPELRFDQIGFSDVVDFLRDVTGANIQVDWASLEKVKVDRNAPVSARLRDVKLSKVLDVFLADVGGGKLTYLAWGDVIWIMAKDDLAPRAARLKAIHEKAIADPAVKAVLDKRLPDVRLDAVGLADSIDFLRDVTGANIFVNWRDLEANGTDRNAPVTIRLRGVRFGDTLMLMLESLPGKNPIDFSVKENVITIEVAKPTPE
jgi:hypothetical protein